MTSSNPLASDARLRIMRRPESATAGPPDAQHIYNAELSYNEADDTLYIGKGISSGITCEKVIEVGGLGSFISRTKDQTVNSSLTFTKPIKVPEPVDDLDTVNKSWVESQITTRLNDYFLESSYSVFNTVGLIELAADAVIPFKKFKFDLNTKQYTPTQILNENFIVCPEEGFVDVEAFCLAGLISQADVNYQPHCLSRVKLEKRDSTDKLLEMWPNFLVAAESERGYGKKTHIKVNAGDKFCLKTQSASSYWLNESQTELAISYQNASPISSTTNNSPNNTNGSNLEINEITLDFGTNTNISKTFTFTKTGASTTQKVMMNPSAKAASEVTISKLEEDMLVCSACVSAADTITAIVFSHPNPIKGKRIFNYTIA